MVDGRWRERGRQGGDRSTLRPAWPGRSADRGTRFPLVDWIDPPCFRVQLPLVQDVGSSILRVSPTALLHRVILQQNECREFKYPPTSHHPRQPHDRVGLVISSPSITKGSPSAQVYLLELPPAEWDLEVKPVPSTRSQSRTEPVSISASTYATSLMLSPHNSQKMLSSLITPNLRSFKRFEF